IEAGGIRCCYHGWVFDVNGRCLEQPGELPASSFKDKIRLKAYPVRELGGMLWSYLGQVNRRNCPIIIFWSATTASEFSRIMCVSATTCSSWKTRSIRSTQRSCTAVLYTGFLRRQNGWKPQISTLQRQKAWRITWPGVRGRNRVPNGIARSRMCRRLWWFITVVLLRTTGWLKWWMSPGACRSTITTHEPSL